MPDARPLPTVIGPTENALRALLNRLLATTPIRSYEGWVVINAVSNAPTAGSAEAWQRMAQSALKVGSDEILRVVCDLRSENLVADDGKLSAFGAAELAKARSAVSAATSRLVDGIAADDQATVRRVLDHVRARAEDLLRA